MSNSIDQRIVEMQFDNAQFEKGVATTMKSLQNLDKQLELKNGAKGLESIDKAAASVDFSSMEKGASNVSRVLSTLGDLGVEALEKISSSLTRIGTEVVKGVTIQPLTDGLGEYTTKLNSIQTIQANTMGKSTMRDITDTLDDLNTYADKTIYNFAEMTRNIGTFTAAGVGLKESQVAIKGIANMAASSGASSYDASRAMYQLSQALASGTLKLQDWNSVVNANMGGKLFQDALLATSDALKTGGRAAVETYGSFRESLRDGWITQDVLTKTLRNFTLATKEMDENTKQQTTDMLLQEGYTQDQIDLIYKQADVAQEAATKVKTFEQLVDTTREALGSGWASTWEYIIGDLDQAKDLWTPISDRLNGMIDAFSSARNDLLRVWSRGDKKEGWESGRQAILDGLKELVAIADAIVKPITDAWNSVFTAMNPKDLIDMSVGFREFAKGLRESFEHSTAVKAALTGLQIVFTALFGAVKLVATAIGGTLVVAFKVVGTAVKVVFTAVETVARIISSVFSVAIGAAEKLGKSFDFFKGIADFLRQNTGIDKNLANIVEYIDRIVVGLGKIFSGKIEEGSAILDKAFSAISNNFNSFRKGVEKFAGGGLQSFLNFLANLRSNAPAVALKIYTFLGEQFKKLQPVFQPVASGMEAVGKSFVLALDAFKGLASGALFEQFTSRIGSAFSGITDFADPAQLQKLGTQMRSAFKSLFSSIGSEIGDFFKKFTSGLNLEGSPVGGVIDFLGSILEKLTPFVDQIKAFGSGLVGEDPLGGFASFVESLKTAFSGINPSELEQGMSGISGVVDVVSNTAEKMKGIADIKSKLGNPFEAIGALLADLANGLGSGIDTFLAKIDAGKIKEFLGTLAAFGVSAGLVVTLYNMGKALHGVGEFLESLGDMASKLEGLVGQLKGFVKAQRISMYVNMVKSIAISVAIMAGVLAAIALIGPDKMLSAMPVFLALVGVMTGITVLFGVLGKMEKFDFGAVRKVALSMLQFSLAIAVLAAAVAIFSALNSGSWMGILQIGVLLGMIVGVAAIMNKIDASGMKTLASSMIQLSISLLLMYAAISRLGNMDTGVLIKGGAAVAALLLVIGLMGRLMGSGNKSIGRIKLGGGSSIMKNLLGMAALVLVCYGVVKSLASIPPDQAMSAIKVLGAMALIVAGLATFTAALGFFGKGSSKGTASTLIAMAAAIGIFALAVGGLSLALSGGADVWGALAIIAIGLVAMTASLALLGKFAPQLDGAAAAILGMVVAIGAFTAIILVLSAVPWEVILSGIINVSMILGVFLLALLGIGAIGELVGPGLLAVGGAFIAFGVAMIAIAAALLLGVAALALFTSISGAFVPAFEQFTNALIKCFETEDFVGSMIGMSVAMALLGAACLVLGVGLGILTLAIWAFGEVFPRAVMTVTTAIMQLTAFFSANRDAIATGITNMLEAGVQGIAGFFGKFLEAGGNLVKNISAGLSSHTGEIGNGVADVISTIGNLLWTGITELVPALLELLGSLAMGILEGIANLVTGPIEWLNDKVYEFTGGLMGVAPQAKESAEQLATQTAEGVASQDEQLGESTKAKIDEIGQHIQEEAGVAGAASQEMATAITNPFEQTGASFDFFSAIGLDETTLSGGFDSIKGFFQGKGIELPDELITQFASGASGFEAWNMIQSNGDVDMSQFTTLMGDSGAEGADAFTGRFSEEMSLADVSNLIANAADIDVDTLAANFESAASAAASAFTRSFSENIKIDGSGPMEKAAAALKGSSGSMTDAGSSLGKSVDDGFKKGAKGMKSNASSAAKDAVGAVKSQASSGRTGGYEVGYNMGAGLKSGLQSGSNGLSSLAASIVASAVSAMKTAAKTASPSKETIWISEMMMKGLVVGFDKMRDEVVGSAASVMEDSLSAMGNATYIAGLLDDIDDQPTIRPVLDLTDYEAGINRMKGLNASAPMNSAQWANRLTSSSSDAGYYNNNRSMVINLNYGAGTSAADMVNEMAMILQTKNLMEA